MEPTEQGARMAEFNSYLAEGLHGSMDPKSEQVIWLRHCLGEYGPGSMLDGRLMLDLIADATFGASAAELQRREATFKSKVYFTDAMSAPATRAAFTEFIADHRLLPDHAQGGPFQAHHDLLKKLPQSCARLREKYARRMYQEQAQRRARPSVSLREILDLAIVDILREREAGVHMLVPPVPPRDQRQRSGPGRGGRARACTICGEEGHSHFDCSKFCKSCTLRRCPGSRIGQVCAVASKTRPNRLTDALGTQLSSEAFADVLAAWRKKNPSEAEADKLSRRAAREAKRSVNLAAGGSPDEDDSEMSDDLPSTDVMPREEYGVAALHIPFQSQCVKAYDPREDDSDSEDECYVKALSWGEPARDLASKQGGVMPSYSVHLTQGETTCESEPVKLRIMLDSGASIHLFQTDAMHGAATQLNTSEPLGYINGVGGRVSVSAMLGAQLNLKGGVSVVLRAPYTRAPPGAGVAAMDILSTGKLFDDTGIVTMLDPTPHLRMPAPSHIQVPLQREGRYYMLEATVTCLPPAMERSVRVAAARGDEASSLEAQQHSRVAAEAATSLDDNDMWAARLCLSSRGLKKLVQATKGTGIKAITHRMALIADSDIYRAASVLRRQPVPRGHSREFLPGQCFEYDVWGPAGAPSANGGERFDLHALCVASGYAHVRKTHDHVASTVTKFFVELVALERSFGHTVLTVRMDRAPEHESEELRRGMRDLGVVLELTPRNHHEGVGRAENDSTQRMAETFTRRAGLTLGYIIDARIHAWRCRNVRCAAGRAHTRQEEHTGMRPDFSQQKPYTFGVKCLVLQDEAARGQKGSLLAPRSLEGTLIGFEGAAYLVRLDNGAGVVRQRSIKPLNERALLLRGMPPGTLRVDGSAQTEQIVGSSGQLPTPAVRPDYFPARTPIEIGAHPDMIGPPSMRTRSSRQQRILQIYDSLELAENQAEAREMFNAAVFQLLGDADAELLHCDEAEQIDEACAAASLPDVAPPPSPAMLQAKANGVFKATQTTVQVQTPLGISMESVPASCKQVREHPQRLRWEAADTKARDVLLRAGNKMVTLDSPEAAEAMVVRAVVQRKIKLDADTGALAKHDAYKSRICVDGRQLKLGMTAIGLVEVRPMHAQTVDDFAFKMLVAKVAHERGTFAKIDIVNAYAKATRNAGRKGILIRMPETVRENDESGAELYMLGLTPLQGEEPSGDEWWAHINESLTSLGAHLAESVGGLYSGNIEKSSFGIALIVDDLFVGEWGGEDYLVTRRLKSKLDARYGEIKYEEHPTAFTSYAIAYNRTLGCVTIYMTQKCLEAAHEYLPQLTQGVRPSARLKKGETLERLADELRLPPAEQRRSKLDKEQQRVQKIIGSLKFLEKTRIDLSLPIHRLSCIMSCPPKEATLVAELVLERAYDGRNTGITYGGVNDEVKAGSTSTFDVHFGAPLKLQGVADATWSQPTDLYGVLITANGGAVFHQTKKIGVVLQSSMEAEGYATGKLSEGIVYGREIAHSLGIELGGATRCATDNSSNLQVSSGTGAANRTRHCVRRFLVFRQRVMEGLVSLEHVKDENNPADFLTKWMSAKKFKLSLAYASNSHNVVKPSQIT